MQSPHSNLCLTAIAAACAMISGTAFAQTSSPPSGQFEWVTLGTVGGPMAQPGRNEPANVLVKPGEAHLIDAGDGAMSEAVAAGADFRSLRTIWISHIHFDHIGGLYAALGLRLQSRSVTPLTIYGPPGMKDIVKGLVDAMRPSARSGFGVPGEQAIDPGTGISVIELKNGDVIELPGFKVRVADNTHYSFKPGTPEADYFHSLSFRFDLPERSIVYTGDTGPSEKVIALAKGADLLVTEMIDLDSVKATMARFTRNMSQQEIDQSMQHLTMHHLTTAEISAIASKAGVLSVVVTHIAGGGATDPFASERYRSQIQKDFNGPVRISRDMDRY